MKCKKATKYFDYCLYLRPTNGYLHYIYSNYLMIVMKKYKESYFHLRMSKRLWPGLHIKHKYNKNENENQCGSYQATNGTNYTMCLTKLCDKMNNHHRCYFNPCDKILSNSKDRLLVCSGCKSAHYCSKSCQKKDWKLAHRHDCVGKYLKPLNDDEIRIYHQILQMLNI